MCVGDVRFKYDTPSITLQEVWGVFRIPKAGMQSPPRPQFATWLLENLESRQYGLCYVGPNKFRVPWKHNSRKDCSDEDCRIFWAWAVASGKIKEFPNDKARWKTNFRCALNNLKGRFRMVEDNSKSDDPHKVYEITNPENWNEGLQMQNSQEDSDPDIYSSPIGYFPSGGEINLLKGMNALEISNIADPLPVLQPYVNCDIITQSSPAAAENYPLVSAHANNIEIAPEQPYYEPSPVHFTPTTEPPTIHELEISIFYRKKEMWKEVVNCQQLQFHYPMNTQDPNNIQHAVCFPSTECLIDHKQIEYTKRILSSIQRGLTLHVNQAGIYACRQDRCHVFATTSDPNVAQPNPQKLPLNTMMQLLNFAHYVQELKTFGENNGPSPKYTIYMCFGEKFPDGKPLEKKLIIVKVVPLICRYYYEEAQKQGASSLHSSNISLQTSHNSLMDLINSIFGLPNAEDHN